MPFTRNDVRYYAGFFDGEGSISLIRRNVPTTRRGYRYFVQVSIGQVSKEILEPLRVQFGGSWSYRESRTLPNAKPVWNLRWWGLRSTTILKALLPYLRLKKHRAELAIEARQILSSHRGGRGHRRYEERYLLRLEEIYMEMKYLNKKGRR